MYRIRDVLFLTIESEDFCQSDVSPTITLDYPQNLATVIHGLGIYVGELIGIFLIC